jgi:2-oxoisovalerate dehydrogenase E1 component
MKNKKLKADFDWQRITSSKEDITKLDPHIASRILFDTFLINMFEHELLRLKNNDCVWGPVHSSVGQEAVAAAAMAGIKKSDKITGSHRAHHQFLSKAVNYVLDEDWDGRKEKLPDEAFEVVQKTLAEIMGLSPGYCGGRGGSMHLRYPEAGVLGTNAIVAGGIPLATGAAYAEKFKASGNIIVCFFGDGAANQGSFHEALNLAGIWDLPIVYFIENNEYAVGTAAEEAAAVRDISQRAASYSMTGRIVEGDDVVAMYETMKECAEMTRSGSGPCIIEAKCYRHYHHAGDQPGSAYGYRDKAEEEKWLKKDAVKTFPQSLSKNGVLTEEEIERIREMAREAVDRALDFCTTGEDKCQAREELWPDPATATEGMRSDGKELEGLAYKEKEDFDRFEEVRFSDGIATAIGHWLEKDETVMIFGEEVANFGGGAYGATKGLPAKYPERVINTPISEAGFVGLTCGAAMSELRPIVEIMFPDFTLVAADQVFNQIGKARHMYGNTTDLPLVARARIATGVGYGGQHSMDPVGLFALFSGWRIVAPSNAFDYIGLFNTAMTSLDPVLFLEHHSLYGIKFPIPKQERDYYIPFGKANRVVEGEDITVLTYSSMTGRLERLIEEFESAGVSVELIDLRTLDLPSIDYETIGASLKKTGALAVVEHAAGVQGIGDRIASAVTERFFDELDAPPGWITSANVPNPVSRKLEEAVLISDEEILDQVTAMAKRKWK